MHKNCIKESGSLVLKTSLISFEVTHNGDAFISFYYHSLCIYISATVYSTNFIQIAKCSVLHTDQLYISLLWWQFYELVWVI